LFVLLASLKSFLGAEPPHSDVTGAPTQPIINGISEHCEKQCSLLPAVLECTNNKKEEVASSRRFCNFQLFTQVSFLLSTTIAMRYVCCARLTLPHTTRT
jgi:hypothetical protein